MKEYKIYCCEICGTNYSVKADAQACEKNHKKPLTCIPTKWKPKSVDASGYPLALIVSFPDGRKCMYMKGGAVDD